MKNPKLAAEIAKQLREFHQVEVPGSKEPQLWIDMMKFFEKGLILIVHFLCSSLVYIYYFTACVFSYDRVLSFDTASTIKFDDIEKQRLYESISFKEINNEITELKVASQFIDYLFAIIITFSWSVY